MVFEMDERSIPEMFAARAAQQPGHVAVIDGEKTYDFGGLDRRANQIAHFIISKGAGPEVKIGIAIGRSADFVAAALGVLKSGAAYVPLDLSYPEARLRMIAEDAGLKLTLTSEEDGRRTDWMERAVSVQACEIASKDSTLSITTGFPPDQLAYVIYTSGSTGAPKGVEVTHGNLLHLVRWHNRAFAITPDDHCTLIANVGFDAAVWELWPALCGGATLLIPPAEIIRQPEELQQFLLRGEVSVFFAPTLLAEALMGLVWPKKTSLRTMLTGGDVLRRSPAAGLPFAIINNYGPAECTVVSTSGTSPSTGAEASLPSIGEPIDGAKVDLLDEQLRAVDAGSQGEICIGGGGVARGYLNRPELTAERFVRHPETGERMYRSGDLGRMNTDGSIQFMGRLDEQIKVRGYRIECGEIEAALTQVAGVQSSAVTARAMADGHLGIVAYVVTDAGSALSHGKLREELRKRLPAYMIPEQFMQIDEIPISENGKIDRRRLPEPAASQVVQSAEAPASPVETELKAILIKLLGVDQMDRDDDFFLLGGHSFIAAQLIARIRGQFGVELGLRALFENPTLAGMAEMIEQRISVTQ